METVLYFGVSSTHDYNMTTDIAARQRAGTTDAVSGGRPQRAPLPSGPIPRFESPGGDAR